MNNVTEIDQKPFYLRVKVCVSTPQFTTEGFVYFGPFNTEGSARRWYTALREEITTNKMREYGSLMIEVKLDGFTIERDLAKIYHFHCVRDKDIKEVAKIVPNLLLREVHIAYEFLSEATYGQKNSKS